MTSHRPTTPSSIALLVGLSLFGGIENTGAAAAAAAKPSIVYILADDLGYGDLSCYNSESKIATPHIDRLAREGMRFTDAHTSSSVCTPSRYSILTGRYAWRTRLQSSVLRGFSPPLIPTGRITVASFLKAQGYATACVGKWHLGMIWPTSDGRLFDDRFGGRASPGSEQIETIDWTRPITGGPVAVGFSHFYGITASLDMPPFAFIRDDRVVAKPTGDKRMFLPNGLVGPATDDFEAVTTLPKIISHAVEWIGQQRKGKPFFLYLPLTSPHAPIVPTAEFVGKSGLNPYGDFMLQTDVDVGKILAALEKAGLTQDTLVIFTADNGCAPIAKVAELRAKGHDPVRPWRGLKADIWEGGHRVPFLVRWPARVKPGQSSDETICLSDLLATAAAITGTRLPANSGEDSINFLPALLGEKIKQPLREGIVHHSIDGKFAIRQGPWKLALCPGSGGWGQPNDLAARREKLPSIQLYNLSTDPGETTNLEAAHPEIVARLKSLLELYVEKGRSTPGPAQKNDVPVDIYKPAAE